jgi:hypothetical protein
MMEVRVRRDVPRKGFLVGRPGSICRRVLRMSRGWTMMVERRPAERPATLGVLLETGVIGLVEQLRRILT